MLTDTRDSWVLTVPKPSKPARAVTKVALFSLALGLNLGGFVAQAWGAESAPYSSAECAESAELHYELSGGQDAAWEDALEACSLGMTYTAFVGYEPTPCEQLAGAAYDLTGVAEDYLRIETACNAGHEVYYVHAYTGHLVTVTLSFDEAAHTASSLGERGYVHAYWPDTHETTEVSADDLAETR